MKNNSSQNKFAKVTAKVIMALLAICLILSAAPFVAPSAFPEVNAAAVTYQVPAGASVAAINSQLNTYASGTEVNMILGGDVEIPPTDSTTSTTEIVGIVIPQNITVNLYLNGKNIKFDKSNGFWQVPGVFGIVNNGNLNIYSGSTSRPDLASGTAGITMSNIKTGMSISKDEKSYARLDGIVNNGNLTVNKNVSINITNYVGYKDQSAERGACTVAATAIYNSSNTISCKINSATIDVLAQAHPITERTSSDIEHGRSFGYGIYGGNIDITGNTSIHVNSYARMALSDWGASNKENGCLITVAYDICSGGTINITGGSFTYETSHDCNNAGTNKGTSWVYQGGICYSGSAPMIADATITPPTTTTGIRGNTKTFRDAVVTKATTLPYSGYALFHSDSTPGTTYNGVWDTYNEPSNPVNDVTAGQYVDEVGNIYSATLDTTDDATHPTSIVRGAFDGTYRVHVVYRYWTTSTKSTIASDVVGTDGNVGYSYKPLGDGTNIISSTVAFNGLSGTNTLVKTKESAVSYKSGGASKNNYYWKQFNIASTATSTWFSDFDVTSSSNRGTVFKSFVDTTNNTAGAGAASPIYIFVDYYKVEPTVVTANAGVNGTATVTYTGSAIKASACDLKIRDGIDQTDFTSEYNIDFTDSSLIPVTYTWTGTNAAGVAENGSGQLPVNAGTYSITVSLADDTIYNPNDCAPKVHKNRHALEYTFTLVIEQANVSRGTLSSSVNLTYGETLRDKIELASFTAKGVKNENVNGVFSFTNPSDGTAYKNVGTSNVSVTWTPAYGSDAKVKNYKATTFNVAYKVSPAKLVISPNAATVAYGNTTFSTPYSITITGLVGNDDNDTVKAAIADSINYMILVNSSYVAYSPDDVGAGTYKIRARVNAAAVPAVLSNYTYSYADTTSGYDINELTVTKRGLTVQASAVGRDYSAANYNVDVVYTITAGKYHVDDVRIPTGTGALADNSAGVKVVSGVTKAAALELMTGGAAANYTIAELIYDTGDNLTVEIRKAIPDVATPTVADVFYRRTAKLADISINTAATSVPGTWQWADPSINPTVAVSTYTAKFVPTDSVNYDTKTVDVTVIVKPSAVTVTYNGIVEYGDPVPNITAYTYSSVQDPDFNIASVTTSGNITPSTTYTQNSAVNPDGYPVTISAPNYKDAAGNYTFTTVNGKITVIPRNIEFTVQDASIVYGDNFTASASTVTLTHDDSRFVGTDTLKSITADGSDPVFSFTTTYRYQDNYNVGTYEIKATPSFNTSANYTVSVVNGTLTVTKAPLTIKANNVTLAYNSDVPSNLKTAYTFVGAKKNEGLSSIVTSGVINVDTNYEKGSPVNAEGYPIVIDISEATFKNYSVTVENAKITVIKATPVITVYPEATITYGQSLADAVFTGESIKDDVAGKFVYGAASTVPAFSNDPYTIYTATFVPEDTNNYNTVAGLYISLTVKKMAISGTLAVNGIPMKGETLTVDVADLNPDEIGVYSFAWYVDSSVVGTGTEIALTDAFVGKSIKVVATAQGYYEGTAEYVVASVAPELTSVAEIIKAGVYTNYFDLTGLDALGVNTNTIYDGATHIVDLKLKNSVLANTVIGTVTVKYNGSTTAPVNAGEYNITVDVATPDLSRVHEAGVTTYSPAANLSIGKLIIGKAPYDVTVTIADKVYDGFNTADVADINETGAVTLAGGVKDDVKFDSANAVFTFADANVGTSKNVAIGTAALTGASKDNYALNITLANGAKADITPRTLKVTVDPIDREYQENYYDVDLSFVVDVTTIAPADTSSSVYVNEALATGKVADFHAGQRRVTVSNVELAGVKASNYVLEITNLGNVIVEIQKAVPSYPLPATGIVYYDSGRTLSNISLGDSRWAWDSSVANIIPGAGVHTYNAVYTPDDTANFAVVNYEVQLEIRKAPVVVKAANFTVVYGEYEPTYYTTITGLTGADTKDDLGGYVIMSCAYQPGSDVGDYSIVLTGAYTSANYTFTYVPGKVTVTPRAAYVTAIAEEREYEQGNVNVNVTFSALSNIYAGDSSNVYLSSASVTGTVANDTAGTKVVDYALPVLGGSKADNYTLSVLNPVLKTEILKAHIAGIILPTTGEITYGSRLADTVFTSSYEGTEYGTFSMENPMSTPSAVGTTNNVYKVVFTPSNSLNYATESAYITLTVAPAHLTIDLGVIGALQVEKTLYVNVGNIPSGAEEYIVYRWYRVDNSTDDYRTGTLVASGTTEYQVTSADTGKYIVVVATSKTGSPYIFEGSAATDDSISAKTEGFWERIVKWFYSVIAAITQLFGKIMG